MTGCEYFPDALYMYTCCSYSISIMLKYKTIIISTLLEKVKSKALEIQARCSFPGQSPDPDSDLGSPAESG